ncbi:MAG TPA: Lrp/AsnC family transcriptional regulator [Candidatus Krumholzibacteria bacterium]|nr:Lrp/AsnC family transcriptional regulator [Candidatus Krumholzibacteria bacterium]HPD70308.1 Lrp/AsnC family transcriptional regulator [Candidatus Krumholzibacteria bacterium]HRY39992.1 Lrp/AsnC family transcriptional regulator [Candidatus Krumholzibacteria bacterium]
MDRIDLHLLQALQANARTTNADLARGSDLAPSTTLDRVRRLEDQGVIRGYRAQLDPRALGLGVQALVMINLGHHQTMSIEDFEAQILAVPQVVACHHLTGRYDYLLHVVARDIDHLRELVTRTLAAIQGVDKQETFLVLATPKADQGYPLDLIAANAVPPKSEEA